jgi:hypothetical protein
MLTEMCGAHHPLRIVQASYRFVLITPHIRHSFRRAEVNASGVQCHSARSASECTHISHSFRRAEVNANDAPRKGPFEVTQRVTANTYRKLDVGSQCESEVNIRLLVPDPIHPLLATPLSVSEREQEE